MLVPTIPDISLNDNQATAGKYISKIEDTTDKHKLNITKENLPTIPTIPDIAVITVCRKWQIHKSAQWTQQTPQTLQKRLANIKTNN